MMQKKEVYLVSRPGQGPDQNSLFKLYLLIWVSDPVSTMIACVEVTKTPEQFLGEDQAPQLHTTSWWEYLE